MRTIIFYRAPTGKCPVEQFLDNLSSKEAQKVTWVLKLNGFQKKTQKTPSQEIELAEKRKREYLNREKKK